MVHNHWLVVSGTMEFSDLPIILGMSSSQLTNSIIFQRGGEKPSTSDVMTWMRTGTPHGNLCDQPRPGRTGLALVPAGHWSILGHSREARNLCDRSMGSMCVSWDLRDLLSVVAANSATAAVLEGEELNDLPVTILKFGWGKEHTTDPALVFFHDENEDWHSTSKKNLAK